MSTIPETFAVAVQHHQRGNLRQAEQLYRQVLQADPNHADALHLLGVVAYQTGNYEPAVALIRQALTLNAWEASYYSNLGVAQQALGQIDQALASFREALRLKPDYADAHSNYGDALRVAGRLAEAVEHCRIAVGYVPNHPQALGNLGNALLAQGKLDEALASLHRALSINPNMHVVLNSLGNTYERLNKIDDALRSYEQALRLNPKYAEAHNNMGLAFKRLGRLDEAVRSHQEALRLNPNYAEAYSNLGVVFRRQDKMLEAVQCYKKALELKPQNADACSNLGNVARAQGNLDDALVWYDQALRADPGHPEAHLNRALVWLLQGDWARGLPEYEWRLRTSGFPQPEPRQPRWDGSPLAGRTLLVLAEQGLGDTIHFIRYLPLLRRQGGRVVLQCQHPMQRLLTASVGAADLFVPGVPLPPFDFYVPLASIPGIVETRPTNIPAEVPYLHADADLVDNWRRELGPMGGFKIGIAWQGSPTFADDRQRSIALTQFAPLAQVPGIQLISLQKGPGTEQLAALAGKFPVLDFGSRLDGTAGPFMDTAAIMKNLDLVISSDTAVAHLAGALGAPVWLALPLVPDWRWLLQREGTPWYPTMRLFRQTRYGVWDDVFERMAAALVSGVLGSPKSEGISCGSL